MARYVLSDRGNVTDEDENEEQKKKKKKKKKGSEYVMGDDGIIRLSTQDIAPVKVEHDSFFKSGALEDGYHFGDLSLSLLTTAGDTALNVVKGAGSMVEGVTDLLLYGASGLSDLVGADSFADDLKDLAKKSSVNDLLSGAEGITDKYSFFGDKMDSVSQGLGQVGTIILTGGVAGAAGLGAGATTAITTGAMGLSSMGSGMSEAYQANASDEDAFVYGLSKGVIDAGSELIFGGLGKVVNAVGISKGLSSLDDIFAKKLASKLSSQTAKNLVEFGVKASAEGFEEVLAGVGTAAAKHFTYMSDEELSKLLKDEKLLDQFVIGAVTSGISQSGIVPGMKSGSLAEANKTGHDFVTGLTKNEQTVVDKVYADEVAKAEKKGKLSAKEKNKIYDDVLNDLEKGYIKTDTIEEVLGDRSAYDALEKESKEFDTLYNTATGQLSKAQQNRLAELEAKNNENPYKDALKNTKEQYSKSVFDMVKGDRLSESYREKNRVYEDFQADFDKYKGTKHEEAARKTLESAMKAGANNTNRVHDLVDMAAQISADTGRTFEFKSGEQIKNDFVERQTKVIAEMEKIPAAKRTAEQSKKLADLKDLLAKVQSGETVVNGDITANGIVLNLDSGKPLNRTVGHEVTHSLENAKSYKELKDSLYAYAKSKGIDIDNELNTRKLMYEGVADADPEAELIADLVGDFLFTDSEYVRKLSTENQNVFQKFWDKIKYLCKVATAGSQEARELARVEKAFADAYREGGKAQVGKQYSISETPLNQRLSGDDLLDAEDLIAEIEDVAEISPNGYVTVYHRTTEENAKKIMESGKMSAKEDGIFFSTQKEGAYSSDYGKGVVELKVPVEKLVLDDIFDTEAHLRIPLKNRNESLDISGYLTGHDAKYSLGYHAGDLGKAESLRQQGLGRGTGHFGTGTYFVGNKAAIEGYNSRGGKTAPVEAVDFDKYNLFKPKNAHDGFALHDFLHGVDGYWDRDTDAVNTMEEYESLQGKLNELVYDIESEEFGSTDPGNESWLAVEKEFLSDAKRMMGSYKVGNALTDTLNGLTNGNFQFDPRSEEYYSYDFDTNQFTYYTEDEIIQKLNAEEGGWKAYEGIEKMADDYYSYSQVSRYESWSNSVKDVAKALGVSEQEVRNIIQSVTEDINSRGYTEADMETADSAATRFMKALGYEGIDVRGIKELDNTSYGSVIYDLKGEDLARKKEIGTAKYSLSDSDGKQLTKEQQDYFKDSKMRDENGNLKVMYHGSKHAGFHVFDAQMSDDNTSLFFTDSNEVASSYSRSKEVYEARTFHTAKDMNKFLAEIGYDDYEVVKSGGKYTLYYDVDEAVATSDNLKDLYDEFCDYAGVGEGKANYKVYLNLKNPLVVDAEGRNWDNISTEFYPELYEHWKNDYFTEEEKAALIDLAGWEDYSTFKSEVERAIRDANKSTADEYTKAISSAFWKHSDVSSLFSMASDNFSDEVLKAEAVKQMDTREYAQKAKAEGYDGVIFKNLVDIGEYGRGRTPSTVAIAFDSNQIKSTANAKPTSDPDIRYSMSSMANTFFGDENMTAEQFKKSDYRQTQGYKDYVDQCLNNYRQTRADFDEATARKSIEDSIEGIVKVAIAAKQAGYDIYDDSAKRSKKDSKKRLLFSSLEPNSDYFTSSDISTICDKRKNFAEIYDDIVRAEEAKGVPKGKRFFDNVDNYFAIHKIMADKGLTTPCRQCYVESMRKNLAPMANAFLRLVQETDPNNRFNDQLYHQKGKQKGEEKTSNAATREFVLSELIAHPEYNMSVNDLTVETLTTADGLAQLKLQAPTIYEAFNSFYGQSKPKMPKGATPFRFGELTALLTDEKGKIKKSVLDKINSTGGFRLQSYSDFQIQNYTDVLQVLFEAGTLGLKGHAYTKVPAFLDATEGTNLKRNISIFMYKDGDQWKLDKNDSFPYDLEEIYDLVKADESGNTGIIAVSQNADMSAWIMANDHVGYGIPFHKSGLKMGTVRDTEVKTEDGRVIKGYSGTIDHTKQQTEVWAKAGDGHKAETKVKNGINIYSFWDFDNKSNLSKNELIEKNVKAYIDQCELAGYLPKFRAYVMNNGKVLNDVLKYAKELGFVGEDATIEDISFQYKGYTIPYGYYKFLGDFGMFTPDGKASAQKTLSLENYDFDKAVKFFSDSETLRRNEILQQFSNGEERQRYRDSDLTAGELQDIVKQKRREVAESVVGDIAPSMSLSNGGEQFAPTSSFDISGKDFRVQNPMQDNVAPAQETVSEMESVAEESSVTEDAPVDVVEDETTTEDIDPAQEIKTVKERLSAKLSNSQTELANVKQLREESSKSFDDKIAKAQALLDSKKNQDTKVANNIKRRIERLQRLKADVDAEYAKRINDIESKVTKTNTELEKDHTKQDNLERAYARIDAQLEREKAALAEEFNQRRESLKDKNTYISQKASELYNEIRNLKKGVRASDQLGYLLDTGHDWSSIRSALVNIKHTPGERVNLNSAIESIAREMLNEDYENSLYNLDDEYQAQVKQLEEDAEKSRDEARKAQQRVTRKNLHAGIVDKIKARFAENGFDFDSVLKKAKNLSTFATVDNTPQRVMEKSLGYKEGGVLADLTVNKVAQNETEGIKWLNSFTDRKSGLLANISKQYGIKPGSKASAAAQMYAEGFYVNDNNEIIQYGDAELAQDFKDAKVRENIKKLARDPRIRQIYDETLAAINESRVRNGYPEIPRLDNYFLHFRAMDDTFSRLGLPFNPNDIKAKDLPTDLNGVTADLKPGQPYFASAMHRTGKRTSFDLLGGLEKYLTSAKNQIYHIDDIQTLRALRNYVADTYGQANGLEGLDALTEEEAQDRIEKVYNSHLSTFAKFLNEEANILAGKTALIDRGLEGIIGRRGITFLNTVNGQVGSNMVGFNLSSSLTNFLPVAQTFAKTNKADFVKAFGQTVANKVGSVFGRSDGFTENSPVVIRRKGADRFHRTPYQKVGDLGYVFMSAVDDISTELIARTKYNELTRKGMDSQQAHYETDKWVSRLMGDRSLGQMPQIYNSKMLGLITKFQLEVRNQLDSQFYDTIQEAKVSTEEIENRLERNAKTAAKVTSTFVQLAVVQHLFGMAFESVAGYNPAFDIIEVMIKALGWDDEEESEDTVLDNIEQGFLALLEDLPYASTFTGGRIPIESALPIEQFVKGVDQYGNEKSRLETLGEVAPYYLLPGGYGQIKKTAQGLGMFSDEHPIAGSYTDSGALRFPVEDTWKNRLQAGVFGQYASQNARYYFDNDIAPLKDKQIQEFIDVDMPIRDYWDYRKGLSGLDTLSEKADYIDSLDLTDEQKNILINNIADRKEDIDMSDYGNYGSFEEFDFAEKYPEKYEFFTNNGISYDDYASADEEGKRAYTWASENPGKYEMSKAISDDFLTYWQYKTELGALEGDKDANGKTISGSKKNKVIAYINDMDLDYGQKIILFKSEYNSDDTYNYDIIEYLNGRDDISYRQMETILKVLGFNVDAQGNITWD